MKYLNLTRILSVLLSITLLFYPFSTIYAVTQDASQEQSAQGQTDTMPVGEIVDNVVDAQQTNTTETEDGTDLITPTPQPHEIDEEQILNEIEESNTENIIDPPTATEGAIINTGNGFEFTSSSSAQFTVEVNNNNETVVERNVEVKSTTGGNVSDSNINMNEGISINTGGAEANSQIATIVNTNIVGNGIQPIVVNLYDPSETPIDYSFVNPCSQSQPIILPAESFDENLGNNVKFLTLDELAQNYLVNSTNSAKIINNIDLSAITGENKAINNIATLTGVHTGNATTTLNMFNMANTNLVGECGLFAVYNFYSPQNQDLILPYEFGYISGNQQGYSYLNSSLTNTGNTLDSTTGVTNTANTLINNTNNGRVDSQVDANAKTSDNSIEDTVNFFPTQGIVTGNSTVNIDILDIGNTNIVGNNFLLLKINHFGRWSGNLKGWTGDYYESDNYIILFTKLDASPVSVEGSSFDAINLGDNSTITQQCTSNQTKSINNTNDATIENNINLLANTGDNEAGNFNSEIVTGDAEIKGSIFNLVNTNIVGDHWYFGIINLFDDFLGDIIFPRPDLEVVKTSNTESVKPEGIITYTISYINKGRFKADNVELVDTLSSALSIVKVSGDPQLNGNVIKWNLGTLKPGDSGSVTITALVLPSTIEDITNSVSISTSTQEQIVNNNKSSSLVQLVLIETVAENSEDIIGNNNNVPNQNKTSSTIDEINANGTETEKEIDKSVNVAIPQKKLVLSMFYLKGPACKDNPYCLYKLDPKGIKFLSNPLIFYIIGVATPFILLRKKLFSEE